jgi:N-acetylglucosaminyldiphosphoundecaprenol N-acetyl-beta-D-mannosaminyltransferase
MGQRQWARNWYKFKGDRYPIPLTVDVFMVDLSPSVTPNPFTIFDLPLHLLDNYTDWLASQIQHQQGVHVVTLNAEMSMQAETNPDLAQVIQQAELVIPDGAGIVLYLRLRGKRVQRCPGIELAESLIRRSPQITVADRPATLFFYGGAPDVAQQAAEQWQQHLPDVAIAGVQHGFLNADDHHALCQTLAQQQPSVIFVGLGVPRQEFWIYEHRHLCPNSVWIGVGGSFDIWAGTKTRAPQWLRDNHLEWTYRLYQEPWRWRRMLALPKFAWRALWHG